MLVSRTGIKRMWWTAIAIGTVGLGAALIGEVTLACIGAQYDSIHFHSGQPDYGLPPRRAVISWRGEHDDRPQPAPNRKQDDWLNSGEWDSFGDTDNYQELTSEKDELRQAELDRKRHVMLTAVNADISLGHWRQARETLDGYCNRVGWRGGLRDREQVLRELEYSTAQPAPVLLVSAPQHAATPMAPPSQSALRLYLNGLVAEEANKIPAARNAYELVSVDPSAGFLRAHASYQLAALTAKAGDHPHAVGLFIQLLQQFPGTIKREDALVMIARSALLPAAEAQRRVANGRAALAQLKREFPHTRFRRDLIGLQGRLDFLDRRWPQAADLFFANGDLPSVELVLRQMSPQQAGPTRLRLLAAYLQRLTATHRFYTFSDTLQAIDHTRHGMTSEQAVQFGKQLVEQPEVAAGYLYYRLYYLVLEPGEQRSLAHLADRIVARHPGTRLSVPVQVRMAEVYYRNHQYRRSLFWAQRALKPGPSDRALYVVAASEQKLGRKATAQADYERLLHLFPDSPLRHGVLENLAQFYERQHRFGDALDLYFALDYKPDIAYLLDVRMTPGQIAHYLRRNARSPRRHLIAYSLGIRYLRDERWQEARRMLTSVPHATYLKFANPKDKDGNGLQTDPLRALAELEPLHHAVLAARTDRARASALYWYAHYYATHDELLLYNLALWNGEREINFQFYWNERFATDEDRAAVHDHMYAHETYARSRRICLDLVRRYPDSTTVPYALYRAAVDDLHLATFNSWWVDKQPIDFAKEMHRLKKRLVREYPRHPLAHKVLAHARLFPEQPAQLWRPQHSTPHAETAQGFARED